MTVYRTDDGGRWGTGKGSNLTAAEVDVNFWDIIQRILNLENNPPVAVSIRDFTVVGNQLTINMTDGSTKGPFTIPTSQWRWTGPWSPNTAYGINDIFSDGGAVYRVAVAHTSNPSFDPALLVEGNYVYNLLLESALQAYDMGMYYSFGVPDDGSVLLQHVAVRNFIIPGNWLNSQAFLRIAATNDLSLPIYQNATLIGHIDFTPATLLESGGPGQYGTFVPLSPPTDIQVRPADILRIYAPDTSPPTPDPTAVGLSVTLAALVGGI
jgi:hypothetical protein